MGGVTFTTPPNSNGHTSSHDTTTEAPREIKLNKIAQLKKATKERNQQKQLNELERPLDPVVEGGAHDNINSSHVTISSLEDSDELM